MVAEESDKITINILCTASPYDYAGLLVAKLDWECIASHFSDNDNYFFHVHGNNKIRILDKLYPKNKYDYNFALSDSEGDLKLLALFKKSILYKNNA